MSNRIAAVNKRPHPMVSRQPSQEQETSTNDKTTVVDRSRFFTCVACVAPWCFFLLADFVFDFRFEYLYSLWLLLSIAKDKFKNRCLAFSVCTVCLIAVVVDVMYYQVLPAPYPLLVASCGVWTQYVWCTKQGTCLYTVVLWLMFICVEAILSMHDVKSLSSNIYVCRPFAAHCIGYSLVILNFGPKGDKCRPTSEGPDRLQDEAMTADQQCRQIEHDRTESARTESHLDRNGSYSAKAKEGSTKRRKKGSVLSSKTADGSGGSSAPTATAVTFSTTTSPMSTQFANEDAHQIHRLEGEVKRLKVDLQASRSTEQDLLSQIKENASKEKQWQSELSDLRYGKESLQINLESVTRSRDQWKEICETKSKKLDYEHRVRRAVESRLIKMEAAAHNKAEEVTATGEAAVSATLANAWNTGGNDDLVPQPETGDDVQSDRLLQKDQSSHEAAAATQMENGYASGSQSHFQHGKVEESIEVDVLRKRYKTLSDESEELRKCIEKYQRHLESWKEDHKCQANVIVRLERQLKQLQMLLAPLSQRLLLTKVAKFLLDRFTIYEHIGMDYWRELTKNTIGAILAVRDQPESTKTWMRKPRIQVGLNEVFTHEEWEVVSELNYQVNQCLHYPILLQGIDGKPVVYVPNSFCLRRPSSYALVSERPGWIGECIMSIIKKVDPFEKSESLVTYTA